jgi:pimeloyl-ACP methyl ester carboxylesterase
MVNRPFLLVVRRRACANTCSECARRRTWSSVHERTHGARTDRHEGITNTNAPQYQSRMIARSGHDISDRQKATQARASCGSGTSVEALPMGHRQFTMALFSADGVLKVTETQRREVIGLCEQSAPHASLVCMASFATTDSREDLKKLTPPTLVIHGAADAIVALEGPGQRSHRAVPHSESIVVKDAPHGLNVSHPSAFNDALLSLLRQ